MGGASPTSPDEGISAEERQKAFDALAEVSPDGIIIFDDANNIQYANPAVERILGYTPEALVGEPTTNILSDRLEEHHRTSFQRYLDTGEKPHDWTDVELCGQHKHGHDVPLAISVNDFTHDETQYFIGTFRDITNRHEAKQELQQQKQQLQTLLELLPVGVIVADADGSLLKANETAKQMWGGFAEADSIADYDQYTGWWVESGDPVEPDEWPIARALHGEEVTEPDLIDIERFDGEHRTLLIQAMPLRDETGAVKRAVVTMVDVTEREARKQELHQQNERLNRFASMLAHELRNPLEIAQIYLGFLEDADSATTNQIDDALDRMEEIIEILLVLARGYDGISDREPVGLTGAAKEAWTNTKTDDAELRVKSSLVVDVNPTHLQHLLENLFRNAVEHNDEPITVRVGTLANGFYVEDTGAGISEERREAVMEAGFTTDPHGTGLGLTFVAELANTYDWECTVTESDEGGARFEFKNVETQSSA